MNSLIRRPLALFVAAACGLAAATAQAAVGARVLVQEWNPLTPNRQSVRVLLDQPSLVSDSLISGWSKVRVSLCQAIAAQLAVPGAAAGQTLRDIQCNLDSNVALDLRQNGTNSIVATLTLPSNSITATSTQPTVCGRECDPRFSVSASAAVTLGISVQPDTNRPLVVTRASLSFANANIDSHNFAADIAKWVDDTLVPWFRGVSFQTIATNSINSARFNFAAQFNSALAGLNSQLRGPAQYVRVGLWARGGRVTIAFAPPEIAPPANGFMSGVMRWDTKNTTSTHQSGPPNCAAVHLVSTVQTGPAPLLDPDNFSTVGPAPRRQVGSFIANTMGAACAYTLSGIAATWPNQVSGTVSGGNGGGLVKLGYGLKPDGWKGPVVPNPAATEHNYLVFETFGGAAVQAAATQKLRDPGDPVMSLRRSGDPVVSAGANGQPDPVSIRTQAMGSLQAAPLSGPVAPPPFPKPGVVFPNSTVSRPATQPTGSGNAPPSPLNAPRSTLAPR